MEEEEEEEEKEESKTASDLFKWLSAWTLAPLRSQSRPSRPNVLLTTD